MADSLPLETQTLYAELLEHLLAVQARRSIGSLSGSFVDKIVKGETYLYWQASRPGGKTRQFYLGRRTRALEAMIHRWEKDHADGALDLQRVRRLAAQLRAGGAGVSDGPSARVIGSLADAGVFEAGGVLVGTHAFLALGNALGVRWTSRNLRTQDVDLATTVAADIDVAVPDTSTDLPSVLQSLEMGFQPVPPLDPRHPSTSFKVRGQALRVDLLCPGRGVDQKPVFIPRFKASAQPLAFLDYLLEAPERAAVLASGAALVNLPAPARFAFHKLLVAPLRPAAFQTKAEKDVGQAAEVLDVLLEARPGDLSVAWDALQGRGWDRAGRKGLALLDRRRAGTRQRVEALLGKPPPPRKRK
jgi:hypothetical protein